MLVVLACDQKWRDLPSLVVIKRRLESFGHRVRIVSTKELEPLIAVLQPNLVLLNHFWDHRYQRLAKRLRSYGIAVGVLPTEGAIPTDIWGPMVFGEFTDYSLLDFYLSWNEATALGIGEAGRLSKDKIKVVGCPRFDFVVDPLIKSCMTKAEFCDRFGFEIGRPIVTWASRFSLAKLSYASTDALKFFEREAKEIGYWQSIESKGDSVESLISVFKDALDAFLHAFTEIAKRMPEIQFVFKPHPNDDVEYIKRHIEKVALPNIQLSLGAYIADFIRASDILINSDCSTSVEAWVLNVPVIDAQLVTDNISGRPDIQAGNFVARTVDDIERLILRLLVDRSIEKNMQIERDAFVEKWFGKIDGRRCESAADSINHFLGLIRQSDKRWYPFAIAGGFRRVLTAAFTFYGKVPAGTSVRDALLGRRRSDLRNGIFDKVITQLDVNVTETKLRKYIG